MTASEDPFGAGPFQWMRETLPGGHDARRRAWLHPIITAAALWGPLAILAVVEGHAVSGNAREAFLYDISAYGRYLVAAPLFVLAGSVYLPELAAVVRHFVDADIIAKRDLPRYEALVTSTRRLLASPWASVVLLVLAYVFTGILTRRIYPTDLSTWVAPIRSGERQISLAGWWRLLVSQPIFITLQAVWLWRIVLWARFLGSVTRMPLRLIASHPDRLGGLRFVMVPTGGFAVLALGVGAIAASSVAESIVADGRSLAEFRYLMGGHVALVLLVLAGPWVLLALRMFDLKIAGLLQYGGLASELGRQFETRWFAPSHKPDADALGVPDFSATTDLYSVAANVRGINLLVVDLSTVLILAGATLLPYVPVLFVIMPFEEVVKLALKAIV